MDTYSYHNIFETKGIEYLAIIAFLLLLIPFWVFLNRRRNPSRQDLSSESLIPMGLYFSGNHTWTFLEKSGSAKIGFDHLLLRAIGNGQLNPFRKPGEIISRGSIIAEISEGNKHLKILSPLSGKISEFNPVLTEEPEKLSVDPYGNGWIYRIQPEKWQAETSRFHLGDEAKDWTRKEFSRLKDFLSLSTVRYSDGKEKIILQDGGEISSGVLKNLPGEAWIDFQKEFLNITL